MTKYHFILFYSIHISHILSHSIRQLSAKIFRWSQFNRAGPKKPMSSPCLHLDVVGYFPQIGSQGLRDNRPDGSAPTSWDRLQTPKLSSFVSAEKS